MESCYDEDNKLQSSKDLDFTAINVASLEGSGHDPKVFFDAIITNDAGESFSGHVFDLSPYMEWDDSESAYRVDMVSAKESIIDTIDHLVAEGGWDAHN